MSATPLGDILLPGSTGLHEDGQPIIIMRTEAISLVKGDKTLTDFALNELVSYVAGNASSFRSLASEGFPSGYSQSVCVRLH